MTVSEDARSMADSPSHTGAPDKFLSPEGNLIDGQWRGPRSGKSYAVEDPATGEFFAEIPASNADDVNDAVEAARASFLDGRWSNVSPSERGSVLWQIAGLIRSNSEALAYAETRDSGKPIAEAREDMAGAADIFEYYAGMASKITGQTMPLPGSQFGMALRVPVGVVGTITPWNFPLYVAAWKVAPALACGNSVVLKPSELASLTCLALGQLSLDAGLPPGILNIVAGTGEEAGAPLSRHPDVDVLAFTGGTATGRKVMAARAELVRPVQLELGGKSPNIVFADADLDQAVAGAAFGIFYTQGENCNAGSRLLLQDEIHDEFLARLVTAASSIRMLPPTDERSQIGSLISRQHLDKVSRYVEVGREEGARVVLGGHRVTDPPLDQGYFYAPTILADVDPSFRVFQEEIFGPVVTVTRFTDAADAIRLANATTYGLAAGVWTSNVSTALRCCQQIDSGYVWVNTFNSTPVEAPFGGVKASGFGRDCGPQAIETYTTWKTLAFATQPFGDWYAE